MAIVPAYRFTPHGKYILPNVDMSGKHFPPSIHVHAGQAVFRSVDNRVMFFPELVYDKELPIIMTLFCNGGSRTWKIPCSRTVILTNTRATYQLFDDTGAPMPESIPPERAAALAPPPEKPWCIVRLYVEDPNPLIYAWHVSYSVLLQDEIAAIAWHSCYNTSIFVNNAQVNNSKSIHIISRNVILRDAVSNFAFGIARKLQNSGHHVHLYAHDFSPEYAGFVGSLFQAHMEEAENILLYNFSITDNFFPFIATLPFRRKILYYHNVTPGKWFTSCFPQYADLLDAARTQYPLFSAFDAVLANSRYSLEQIRPYVRKDVPCGIFPPYFTLAPSAAASTTPVPLPVARHALLWVGRITPHKRPDLALAVFDELVRSGVDASLTFVGGGRYDFPGFAAHMDACLARLEPTTRERVRFLQDLSDEQLTWLYRNTTLLLCTSAHEGYCMPLAEAAVCGLPVAAMPQPAVLETLNGGGIVLEEEPAAAARRIKAFLTGADEAERRGAVPVLKPLPTDELVRLVTGDARCR